VDIDDKRKLMLRLREWGDSSITVTGPWDVHILGLTDDQLAAFVEFAMKHDLLNVLFSVNFCKTEFQIPDLTPFSCSMNVVTRC
jgi:hypothetical protein